MGSEHEKGLIVKGHLGWVNPGTTMRGRRFYVDYCNDRNCPTMVTVEDRDSFPCLSPWLQYSVILQPSKKGSLYRVGYMRDIQARVVKKQELLDLVSKERFDWMARCTGTDTQDPDAVQKKAKKWASDHLRKLPDVITSVSQLREGITDVNLLEKMVRWVSPSFRGPLFLFLLRYFRDSFLMSMNSHQLFALYGLMHSKPHAFCFWGLARSILHGMTHPLNDKRKLFDPDDEQLYCDPNYVYVIADDLVAKPETPQCYSLKYPIWSIATLERACEDMGLPLPAHPMLLRIALKIYIATEKACHAYGSSVYHLRKMQGGIAEQEQVMAFLTGERILKWTLGDMGRHEYLSTFQTEIVEINVATMMKKHVDSVQLIDCPFYGPRYIRHFRDELVNGNEGNLVVTSANQVTASYIAGKLGIKVADAGDPEDVTVLVSSKGSKNQKTTVVVDRVHKMSCKQLADLLPVIPKGCHLILVGDATDFPAHPRRGGGNIFEQFVACLGRFPITYWHDWDANDPMKATYARLTHRNGIQLAHLDVKEASPKGGKGNSGNWKFMFEALRKWDQAGKSSGEHYHIFVSTKEDKKILMGELPKRKPVQQQGTGGIDSASYDEKVMFLHKKVHVMEKDVIGQIEEAYKLDGKTRERTTKVTGSKMEINLYKGIYELKIAGKWYQTDRYTIEHADVHVISKFAGAPAAFAAFWVTKSTTRKHLWCAAKYCTREFRIFASDGVNLVNLEEGSQWYLTSDLSSKLDLVYGPKPAKRISEEDMFAEDGGPNKVARSH